MALCDYLIAADITGYNCSNPPTKGAEATGVLVNRADIESYTISDFDVSFTLPCGGYRGYAVTQSGKQPWNGTQQEMVEGAVVNTLTNTVVFNILKQDNVTAEDIFALVNGEFVAIIPDKQGHYQVFGIEAGLHCTGAVRELYNDDVLAGWQITLTEEGASRSLFTTKTVFTNTQQMTAPCNP